VHISFLLRIPELPTQADFAGVPQSPPSGWRSGEEIRPKHGIAKRCESDFDLV
jgi:hypothetical protein